MSFNVFYVLSGDVVLLCPYFGQFISQLQKIYWFKETSVTNIPKNSVRKLFILLNIFFISDLRFFYVVLNLPL